MNKTIKAILSEKKLKLTDVHRKIVKGFGKKAITYRSLQRIIANQTQPSTSSLYQLCIGLGVAPNNLQLSDEQSKAQIVTNEKNPKGVYLYDPDACAAILTDKKAPFACMKLSLKPKARIQKKAKDNAYKFVFVLRGKIKCLINGKEYTLEKGQAIQLDKINAYSLENVSSKTTSCFIVQYPNSL